MTCDSCGAEVPATQPVHRKYVTPAAPDQVLSDQVPSERVLPDVEQWCFPCSTLYPHDLA